MKKQILEFTITSRELLAGGRYVLLKMKAPEGTDLSGIRPGQFVQVDADCKDVLLRRPISINRFDSATGELWLLVRDAGKATGHLVSSVGPGSKLNILMPLGNGFTVAGQEGRRVLLVGGGVGVAPLLQLGIDLRNAGAEPEFLLGARTEADLLEMEEFRKVGTVNVTTEDGSAGVKGFVTDHPALSSPRDMICCCGPAPMMKAVAAAARAAGICCEVSLENMMACGLGACLCCVEKTVKGNVCVCTEGPVFNINQLTW